jgi:hypothetical protein
MARRARLSAAALAGGFAGLLLGALYLGYQAYAGWHFTCGEDLVGSDCTMTTSAYHDLARMQALVALALALGSAALLLLLRLRLSKGGER